MAQNFLAAPLLKTPMYSVVVRIALRGHASDFTALQSATKRC
jgi:hypothetical protein